MSLQWYGTSPKIRRAQWLFCADLPCSKNNLAGSVRGKVTTKHELHDAIYIAVHRMFKAKVLAGKKDVMNLGRWLKTNNLRQASSVQMFRFVYLLHSLLWSVCISVLVHLRSVLLSGWQPEVGGRHSSYKIQLSCNLKLKFTSKFPLKTHICHNND